MPDEIDAALRAARPVAPDPAALDPGASVWSTFVDITTDGLGAHPAKKMGYPVVPLAPQSSVQVSDISEKDLLIAAQQKQIEALERHIARLEAALDKAV